MEVSGHLHVPTALPSGENTLQYPLDRSLHGPQSRSGRCEEEKNLALPLIELNNYSKFYGT
jgi:hypothetical protein